MRRIIVPVVLTLLLGAGDDPLAGQGLTQRRADPADVATVDAIVGAFYDVISGPAGEPREWARDSTLYVGDVRFTIVGPPGEGGEGAVERIDHAAFAAASEEFLLGGFFESEVHRVTHRFGPIVQVFSTYEWRREPEGPVGGRGINGLQLAWDGERWWIVSAMWTSEGPGNPIPPEFLPRREPGTR